MNPILKKVLIPAFKSVAELPLGNPHSPYEVEYMVKGLKPVCIIDSKQSFRYRTFQTPEERAAIAQMQKMIQNGDIILIGKNKFDDIELSVYAHVDKVEEGKELYARYYEDDRGYKPLEGFDWHKRIGELLGYSKRDITMCEKKGLYSFILNQTNKVRKKIRYEYLIK